MLALEWTTDIPLAITQNIDTNEVFGLLFTSPLSQLFFSNIPSTATVIQAAISPGKSTVATLEVQTTIIRLRVWNLENANGTQLPETKSFFSSNALSMAVSPDGNLIALGTTGTGTDHQGRLVTIDTEESVFLGDVIKNDPIRVCRFTSSNIPYFSRSKGKVHLFPETKDGKRSELIVRQNESSDVSLSVGVSLTDNGTMLSVNPETERLREWYELMS